MTIDSFFRRPRFAAATTVAGIVVWLSSGVGAWAALRLWTGAGPNAFWSTAANWNPAGPPLNGDDLGFLAGMARQTSTNDLAGRTFHSIIFNGAGANYTLFGNPVTLVAGVNDLGGAQGSLNFSVVTLSADQEFIADGSRFNVSSDVALNGHTLTLRATTSNSTVSVIGSISGVGDVVKVGVGQGLFGGPEGNTYQGTLHVTEGIMLLGKGSFGNRLAVPGDLEIGSTIGDSDPFVFGKVVLLRANMITNTGTITINHGSLNQNGFDLTVGPLRLFDGGINTSNATLTPTATISQPPWPYTRYPFLSGNVLLPSDITFDLRQPGSLGVSAVVSGPGGIVQRGYGTLELSETNTFSGAVTVNGGLLHVYKSTQALGQNPVVTLNQDGLLGLEEVTLANKTLIITSRDAGLLAVYEPCAWAGPIQLNYTGQAQFTAGGTFAPVGFTSLRLTGPIHGTGGIKFGGETIEMTGNNDFGGDVTAACELLKLNTGPFRPFTGSLEVGGSFNAWGYDYGELNAHETNALCEIRWMDTAFQLAPRVVIHTNGWANLNGHDNEFGSLEMTGGRITGNGGKLYLDGPVTTHPAPMPASVEGLVQLSTFPAVAFTVADGPADPDLQITAVISDGIPSGIDKEGDGELLLTAANTYRNATTVGAGVLRTRHDSALGTAVAGTTVFAGGTLYNETSPALAEPLTLSGAGRGGTNGALFLGPATGVQSGIVLATNATVRIDAAFGILSGVISGPGGLTKTGPGSLQLGGGSGANNTYGGDTTVAAGVLVPSKGTGVITIPGHLIIGNSFGVIAPVATVRHFAGFTIGGSVTVNRGGLWDLNGQEEGFSVPALQGRPPLTLNGGGDVQTGGGIVYLPVGGDVVVNPGGFIGGSSSISGHLGLDPGLHQFIVGSGVNIIGVSIPDLEISAAISQTSTAADLVKEGSGEMRLSGANGFTGSVTVHAGLVTAAHPSALGDTTAGTIVNGNGALALSGGIEVRDESLTLDSTNTAALLSLGPVTNVWSGNILLQRTAGIAVPEAAGGLTHSGFGTFAVGIGGPGGFIKSGPGAFFVAGLQGGNNYAGPTTVTEGLVQATRRSALSANVRVTGPNAILRTGRATGIFPAVTVLPFGTAVSVENGGLWAMNATNVETLSRLVGDGRVDLGAGAALTISNAVSCEFAGAVSGTGALNKRGLATLRLSGNGTGYTGAATVFDGSYNMFGSFPNSPITVKNSSVLRGGGIAGDVTVEAGGVVRVDPRVPVQQGGEFQMNSITYQPGGVQSLNFFGPHPTGGNDHLVVTGPVTLNNASLSSGFGYPPRDGDVITLIRKTTAGAVSGIFSSFAEGALRTIGDVPVVFSYVGGDGNDVTLTVTNLPLQAGGSQLVTGRGGSALVPDDCSQLWLVVANGGPAALTGLRGTLRSLTPGVLVTRAESSYPNLASGERGSNASPFQIRTEASFPCGSGFEFELVLSADNHSAMAIPYRFAGGSGFGLTFDGGADRVEVRTNAFLRITNNFTIELWANPTASRGETAERNSGNSLTSRQRFAIFPDRGDLSYGPGHVGAGLSIGRNGVSVFEQGSNYFPAPLVYSNDLSGWTHVALVYANRRPRLYLNGVLARTGLLSAAPFIHACAGLGGSVHGATFGNYDGQLDEVRIWSGALSETQIQANMSRSLAGDEPGLLVYFRCDEGDGTTLEDSAPANPNLTGTLVGDAAFVFPGVVPFPTPGVDCSSGGGACESCNFVAGRFTPQSLTGTRRLNATGLPSVCDPAKPCPDFVDVPDAPVRHRLHFFTNNTPTEACVTAQLHVDCPDAPFGAFGAAAYLGEFQVNQPCANFLGDDGAAGLPTPAFSFRVPAGSNVVVVVTAYDTNVTCADYTLEVFGLPCPPPALRIARDVRPNQVLLQWSSAYPDFRLQSVNALEGAAPFPFSGVGPAPTLTGGKFAVTNDSTAPRRFYRLTK